MREKFNKLLLKELSSFSFLSITDYWNVRYLSTVLFPWSIVPLLNVGVVDYIGVSVQKCVFKMLTKYYLQQNKTVARCCKITTVLSVTQLLLPFVWQNWNLRQNHKHFKVFKLTNVGQVRFENWKYLCIRNSRAKY